MTGCVRFMLLAIIVTAGCDRGSNQTPPPSSPETAGAQANKAMPAPGSPSLVEARRSFRPRLLREMKGGDPIETPPAGVFDLVRYDAPVGKLAAYLTSDPRDGKRHPAIIWITGGDCNSIGPVWSPMPPDNDQTAAAYREAGITMMFPSLRGGNDNPGVEEGFYGEVDDVLAAAEYLAKQPFVDPARIYLGGHSTGGTLALLVAECSARFRAVFSFGPMDNVTAYDAILPLPFDTRNAREAELRAPIRWLTDIKTPTFVFEGTRRTCNLNALKALSAAAPQSSPARFFPVPGATHFTILAPLNRLIADKICRDTGPKTNLAFTKDELARLMK